jgi:membrane protein YdbS with pleckstrin-like domain
MQGEMRKSPIVIVRNFIALQFSAAGVYFLAAMLADYGELWQASPVAKYLEYDFAQAALLFAVETVLILYIFFSWYRETVRVSGGRLVHARGVLFRSTASVPLVRMASATFENGLLGRLASYGTVKLTDASGGTLARLSSMSDPRELVAAITGYASIAEADPHNLAVEREHARLEKKSTFRWDLREGKVNRSLEKATMKTVAAFLNSGGGHLLVGVSDDGTGIGLHHDFATLQRRDEDGWENHFSNILAASLGPAFRRFVHVRHFMRDGKPCAMVTVAPADRPAFLRDGDADEFYIRTGNGSSSLRMSEATAYIQSRFRT